MNEIEEKYTKNIRIQALLDANREFEYLIKTNFYWKINKWWYEQAINNNIERIKLYN